MKYSIYSVVYIIICIPLYCRSEEKLHMLRRLKRSDIYIKVYSNLTKYIFKI